jgi:hypothetical protein
LDDQFRRKMHSERDQKSKAVNRCVLQVNGGPNDVRKLMETFVGDRKHMRLMLEAKLKGLAHTHPDLRQFLEDLKPSKPQLIVPTLHTHH